MPFESTWLYDKNGRKIAPRTLVDNLGTTVDNTEEPADIAELKTCFDNRDEINPTEFENVEEMISGDFNSSHFSKLSATVKNTRYLNKELEKKISLHKGDEAPTDGSELWIDTSAGETFNIPEINDEGVSEVDTWSSSKINEKLTELEKKNNSVAESVNNLIDDSAVSTESTWSATKIQNTIANISVSGGGGGTGSALTTGYDNNTSGLQSTSVQGAIDELDTRVDEMNDKFLPKTGGAVNGELHVTEKLFVGDSIISGGHGYVDASSQYIGLRAATNNTASDNASDVQLQLLSRNETSDISRRLRLSEDGINWHYIYGDHNKPTPEAIGAHPVMDITGIDIDLDTITKEGSYYVRGDNCIHTPADEETDPTRNVFTHGFLQVYNYNSVIMQELTITNMTAFKIHSRKKYIRVNSFNSGWTEWKRFAFSDEVVFNHGSLTLEQVNNPDFPANYEGSIGVEIASAIGLSPTFYYIKYFGYSVTSGYGTMIAIPLQYNNVTPRLRTSDGTVWSDWTSGSLPLSGGVMTGTIHTTSGEGKSAIAFRDSSTGAIGGQLWLFNQASTNYVGGFILRAQKDSTISDLCGKANGELYWRGHPIYNAASSVLAGQNDVSTVALSEHFIYQQFE